MWSRTLAESGAIVQSQRERRRRLREATSSARAAQASGPRRLLCEHPHTFRENFRRLVLNCVDADQTLAKITYQLENLQI